MEQEVRTYSDNEYITTEPQRPQRIFIHKTHKAHEEIGNEIEAGSGAALPRLGGDAVEG